MAGIYIHVPFCISKCSYCDFYSVATLAKISSYLSALKRELTLRSSELEGHIIETIYWGGGTPSLLSDTDIADTLSLIRQYYTVAEDVEITLECNPGDYNYSKLKALVDHGINRFSLGAQSFSDDTLRRLGRRHSSEETKQMFRMIQEIGIQNISLDLIYGIPDTGLEDLHRDLDALLALNPSHVSAYHLIYEEGTPLFTALEQGRVIELPEDISLEMGHIVSRRLTSEGYEHYEISNFALPGMRSRHNSSYWKDLPYIGLGPSAHSYIAPWRSSNPSNLDVYTQSLNTNGFLLREFELITPDLAFEEYLMTRLRTSDGISLSVVSERFGSELSSALSVHIHRYLSEGLMVEKPNGHIMLSSRGRDISDHIISTLFAL